MKNIGKGCLSVNKNMITRCLRGPVTIARKHAIPPVLAGKRRVVKNYLVAVLKNYGFWRLGSINTVGAQLDDADEKVKLIKSAATHGDRMVEAIKNQEIFPDQEDERNQSFEIMKCTVAMLKEEWPFAFDYWKKHWKLEEWQGKQ